VACTRLGLAGKSITTGTRTAARRWKASALPSAGTRAIRRFWEKLKAAQGKPSGGVERCTFAALAFAHRGPKGGVGSADWEKNEPNTKRMGNLCFDRIVDKWGGLPVASVTARHIYALRELCADTPQMANKLLAVLRTLLAFGVPRGYIDRNPANDVKPLRRSLSAGSPSLAAQPDQGALTW